MRRLALLLLSISLLPFPAALATEVEGELVLGIVSTKTTRINPLEPIERDIQSIYAICYDSLIEIDDDYRPAGRLAKSWTESNGGKTWTFKLQENVTFSDGTPLTAHDVVATTQYILDKANQEQSKEEGAPQVDLGYYQNLRYFVKSVSATDDTTVVFKADRGYYGFLYALTYPILPADQIEAENPPGTGAYVIRHFEAQDYMWLQANSNWWQTPPSVQEIMVIFHSNNKDLISSYEYNRVDSLFTRNVSASQYKSGVSSVSLDYRTRQLEVLFMNHREQALKSVNVRKAIRHLINVDQIISQVYMGMADRADTPVLPGTWLAKDIAGAFDYNPTLAIQLLEEDGWYDTDGDGVRDRIVDGTAQKLRIRLSVYEEPENDVRVATANYIADALTQAGFLIVLEVDTYQNVGSKLKGNGWDLVLCSVNMDPVQDPGFLLMGGNTMNYGRYSSKDMDALFKQLRSSVYADEYQSALYKIQEQFAQDYPFVSLFYRKGVVVSRKMYTLVRQVRELELLRGIDAYGK